MEYLGITVCFTIPT